ncbi:MAG TPA: PadR family transcriptional regulator [Terracidiphilus sp.]|nr:PadR family transcriptional regulator [Terracidiphilus sp.]
MFGRHRFEQGPPAERCGQRFGGREEFCGPRGWAGRHYAQERFAAMRGGDFDEPGAFGGRGEDPGFGGRGGGFGGGFGRHGFGRGFGGRERMFDAGEIRLVILRLLQGQPSYGYQLMKTMEERLGGGYTPSAGVVYPTLTMLEEEGLIAAQTEGKKVYSVTEEGAKYLEANKERVGRLFERLEETGRGFRRGRAPELMKAFMDLRGAVMSKVWRRGASPEQIKKIAEAIHRAAEEIDKL